MGERATAELPASDESFSLMVFTKAFIAGLVSRDLLSIRPHHPSDRMAFSQVVRTLDQFVDCNEDKLDRLFIRDLVHITNQLRESNSGGFEGFESALRAQQLTFSRCPNPFYEEIEFPVPKVQALEAVEHLPERERQVVMQAVDSFVQTMSA